MKPHHLITCIAVLFLHTENAIAQAPEVEWAHATGSYLGGDVSADVAVNHSNGDVMTTGYFCGETDFDPGIGEVLLTPLGINDIYVAKYDQYGALLWVKQFGGAEDESGVRIKFDPSGNGDFYLTGFFSGYMDIDPDPVLFFGLQANTLRDIFLAKFNSSGGLLWARSFGSTGAEYIIDMELAMDDEGGVVLGGTFRNTCDFDITGDFEAISNGGLDIYVVRYDAEGNVLWLSTLGGENDDQVFDLSVAPATGEVYVAGYFREIVDFDPGPDTFLLESRYPREFYLLKLGDQGSFKWVKGLDAWISEIWINPVDNNSLLLYGSFFNSQDLDPDPLVTLPVPSAYQHMFLMQLDTDGIMQSLKTIGSDGEIYTGGMFPDPAGSGDIAMAMNFQGTLDIPGTGSFVSAGEIDILVVGVDINGNYKWTKHFGGPGVDVVWAITGDQNKQLYVGGLFYSTQISFDGIQLQNADDTQLASDVYIAKLIPGTVSVKDNVNSLQANVYPNPASSHLIAEWISNGSAWTILLGDELGRIIDIWSGSNANSAPISETFNLPSIPAGQYFIQLQQGNQRITKMITIQ